MNNERKILYLSVGINFIIGIIIGIILFFGQLRSGENISRNLYEYDADVSLGDFIRTIWSAITWLLSVIAAHSLLRAKLIHPIIIVRGCVNSFSVLYVLYLFGIKEAVAAFIPQCFSVLPILLIFSAETVYAQKHKDEASCGAVFRKTDVLRVIALSFLSAGAEILIFKGFCTCLF